MANKKKETPAQKGSRLINEFSQRMAKELNQYQVEDYIVNPQLPRILIQPSLLIVPKLGKLIAVEIAYINPLKNLWDFSLERIEQLFELKLALPEGNTYALLIIQDLDNFREVETPDNFRQDYFNNEFLQFTDAIQLLKRFFDTTTLIPFIKGEFDINYKEYIHNLLNSEPKENMQYLWDMENKARHQNSQNIIGKSYVRELIETTTQVDRIYKPISHNLNDLRERSVEKLKNQVFFPNYKVDLKPRVFNSKQFFLNSGISYYFTFDFVITPSKFDRYWINYRNWEYDDIYRLYDQGGAFLEVIRGSEKEFGQIRRLQKIATYARFISYAPDPVTGLVHPINHLPNLILILDGSLVGPVYDPKRYLLLLISTGWTPIYLHDLSEKVLSLH